MCITNLQEKKTKQYINKKQYANTCNRALARSTADPQMFQVGLFHYIFLFFNLEG